MSVPERTVEAAPAAPLTSPHLPRSFLLEGAGNVGRDLSLRELAAKARDPKAKLWVDLDSSSRQQFALLEKVFNFHPLAIEDVLNPNSRPKVEEYDGFLFVIVRVVRFCDQTQDPYDLETINLYFFIGTNFLVTAHAGQSPAIDIAAQNVVRSSELLARGPARMAHHIMDISVDEYFPILDRVDDFIDSIEERVFTSFDEAALRDIFSVKRMVLSLRRYLSPQREIFNVLTNRPSPLLPNDAQLYFRDVYDHMLRINDAMDTYRDLLSSTMESYLSQVSNRLGQVSKGLAVVATLSVPFVVVSGMWGMNFDRIPLAKEPWGFELMLFLQLALGFGLVAVLKKMKWL